MKSRRKAVFVHGPELERMGYPEISPLKTTRAAKTLEIIRRMGFLSYSNTKLHDPSGPADRVIIERFHEKRYIDALLAAAEGDLDPEAFLMGIGTPDCPVFKDIYNYPALACGATLDAAELIIDEKADIVFNPSGGYHHAGPAKAAGFCFLNDVVLCCMALVDAGKRVCFVDVDAHHGDGVQDAFYDTDSVMTISMHESGETLFPGTGAVDDIGVGPGEGYSVNIPLPAGTCDNLYVKAFSKTVMPLLKAYDPDVIVMELGMDALAGDPLVHLNLTNNAYADVIEKVMSLNKPLLATGGGGYNPENTARGWALAWSVMAGLSESLDEMSFGLGGVMLASTDWQGGLRDRVLQVGAEQVPEIEGAVSKTIAFIRKRVFPIHGI